MAILSSLLTLGSTKAVATAAAAVLIVGGGAAVAEVTSAEEPGDEILNEDDTTNDDETNEDVSTDCPGAASTGLDTANDASDVDQPGECPPAEKPEEGDDAPEDQEAEEVSEQEGDEGDDETPEEAATNGEDQGDAEAFSTWVESLDGDELGCLKGQLVSYFARQGPTNFEEVLEGVDGDLSDAEDIADFLKDEGGLPGSCAERVLNGEASGGVIEDLEDTEADRSSSEAGPPADAGKPENVGKPQVDTQERPSPPAHAGSNGDGPGQDNAGQGKGPNG